ncbi:hypothetical protein [Brevibacillus sp. NRS-1366]|uniref:hypothetical protein n=1 Tax=Brevibacillus sp. NRS-1366 TaxID=3233899 RepID=UPI003D1D5665
MRVLEKGIMPNGTSIQIEEWSENYSFMPYGSTIASYPKSKVSHEGTCAPKGNQSYRFSFNFKSEEETKKVFNELLTGGKALSDFKENLSEKKYADCL